MFKNNKLSVFLQYPLTFINDISMVICTNVMHYTCNKHQIKRILFKRNFFTIINTERSIFHRIIFFFSNLYAFLGYINTRIGTMLKFRNKELRTNSISAT